jgi:hypothetical protein
VRRIDLVAWQYQWRHVVAYTFAVMTLTIVMNRHTSALNTVFALNLIQALNMLTFGYAISTMMAHLQTQRAELVQANLDLRHYASTWNTLLSAASATGSPANSTTPSRIP